MSGQVSEYGTSTCDLGGPHQGTQIECDKPLSLTSLKGKNSLVY